MITAQDIREKTFDKAKFGGYDMASVDDFLEELADDVTASQKENAVLKSKMKVLVDKIEEYRANEEALNMAVLSAQKLAVQIEADARQRSAAMLADADRQVKARVGSIEEETLNQERRLADAKAVTVKFFDGMRALCNAQLKNLDAISSGVIPQSDSPKAAGRANVDDAVRSIENSVARIQPEPSVSFDLSPEMDAPSTPKKGFDSTQPFSL
ncbi:MAG: DivIVA domain-containing protein [Oscillospiraceae bacterium]|nr:DivIVA domain-containing protein [Oscillospiraceae bacterium]